MYRAIDRVRPSRGRPGPAREHRRGRRRGAARSSSAFAAVTGAYAGGVERVGGLGGHADEAVDPRDPLGVGGGSVRVGGIGRFDVVAVAELGVAASDQAHADERALLAGEAEPPADPPVAALSRTRTPARARDGRCPSGCSGSERRIRSSCEINSLGARAAISASRAAGTWRAIRDHRVLPERPSRKRAKHAGSSPARRATATTPSARWGDGPPSMRTQCSGDRNPAPDPPVGREQVARPRSTSRAMAG